MLRSEGQGMRLTGTRKALGRRIEALRSETTRSHGCDSARLGAAVSDVYHWATEYTQTYNQHWVEEGRSAPCEPFPQHPYFVAVFEASILSALPGGRNPAT